MLVDIALYRKTHDYKKFRKDDRSVDLSKGP